MNAADNAAQPASTDAEFRRDRARWARNNARRVRPLAATPRPLSSSWLEATWYKPLGKGRGVLAIATKGGKVMVYGRDENEDGSRGVPSYIVGLLHAAAKSAIWGFSTGRAFNALLKHKGFHYVEAQA